MPAEVQLLFIGLWNLADRRGFLKYRPQWIKTKLFPYRDIDIESSIKYLEGEFVQLIEIDQVSYIKVINFQKHQHCHVREPESSVPKQYWHDASTVQAPCEHQSSREGMDRLIVGMESGNGNARARADEHDLFPSSKSKSTIGYDETVVELSTSDEWKNDILRSYNTTDKNALELAIAAFLKDTKLAGKYPRALSDTKSHFISSLKIGKYSIKSQSTVFEGDFLA